MRNKRDYIVISIESRKGGVGKTITGLNLAHLLVSSGKYEVIFMDLDIAGTEAAKAASSLAKQVYIWKDFLHVVRNPLVKNGFKNLNLIDLFEDYMFGGEMLQAINWDGNILEKGKINILSSFLMRDYDDKQPRNLGPATLFDSLHSQWFIFMVRELIEKCSRTPLKASKKLAVIIDNAPGYSGFEPEIEKWLTDLGPDCGKFLFVCTLDTMDMHACIRSLIDIHYLYCIKWATCREFLEMIENKRDKKLDLSKSGEIFFNKLAETIPNDYSGCNYGEMNMIINPFCTNCGFCFYRQQLHNDVAGENYKKDASKYLAIIINKVPESAITKYSLQIGDMLGEYNIPVKSDATLEELRIIKTANDDKINGVLPIFKDLYRRMIPFAEIYSYQFIVDRLVETSTVSPLRTGQSILDDSKAKSKFINELENNKIAFITKCELFWNKKISQMDHIDSLIKEIDIIIYYDYYLFNAIDKLRKFGIDMPSFRIPNLSLIFSHIDLLVAIMDIKYRSLGITKNSFNSRLNKLKLHSMCFNIIENKGNIHSYTTQLLKYYKTVPHGINPYYMNIITRELAIVELLALNYIDIKSIPNYNDRIFDVVKDIGKLLFSINNKLYNKVADNTDDKHLLLLWEKDKVDDDYGNKFLLKIPHILELLKIKYPSNNIINIYQELLLNQRRFVKLKEDFAFLFDSLNLIINAFDIDKSLLIIFDDLIQRVVVNKSLPYEEGNDLLNALGAALKTKGVKQNILDLYMGLKEMNQFNVVLKKILGTKQWELL